MKRLLLALVFILACPVVALADAPVSVPITGTLTGTLTDQDPLTGQVVTRSVTLTVVYDMPPVYVISPDAYTATLDSGNSFSLVRSATYGDIISGAGSLMVLFLLLFIYVEQLAYGRNR